MEDRHYSINRENIYAGKVVKIVNGIYRYAHEENGTRKSSIDAINWKPYRSILFTPDEDSYANDLLYKSPHYPIFGLTDDYTCLNLGTNAIVVRACCNLGPLLEYIGFDLDLTYEDVLRIRKLFFNGKCDLDNDELFQNPFPTNNISSEIIRDIYIPVLQELGDPKITDVIFGKLCGLDIKKDAFKPHNDEEDVKRISFLPITR